MFIEKLRTELVSLWDKCNFTEAQRSKFSDFYSTLYNEDLLDLHEIELSKVTRHYEECKELYEGFSKLKKRWNQLDELERKSADPDRLKNRGSPLLMEEKERNMVTRSITKLEKDLPDLAKKYYEEKGVPFLYGGMDVADYIKIETEKREESKKCQLTIRKQQKREALTSRKSGLGLFKSTSNLNLAMESSCPESVLAQRLQVRTPKSEQNCRSRPPNSGFGTTESSRHKSNSFEKSSEEGSSNVEMTPRGHRPKVVVTSFHFFLKLPQCVYRIPNKSPSLLSQIQICPQTLHSSPQVANFLGNFFLLS